MFVEGIPNNQVTLKSTGKKPRLHGSLVSLAEYGSFGVEFFALSQRTGNASYAEAAENIYRYMLPDMYHHHGLSDQLWHAGVYTICIPCQADMHARPTCIVILLLKHFESLLWFELSYVSS